MLNNLKISTRLALGFGVVSFLLLLVMFLGLQSLSSLKAGLTAANSTSQYAKATGDTQGSLLNLVLAVQLSVGGYNDAKMDQSLAAMAKIRAELEGNVAAFTKLDPAVLTDNEKALIAQIEAEAKKFAAPLQKIGELLK
ncbi:MAG: MCP four helix bundle domain-containing protein, partial [Sedimentisphaerales bacterium]|nr:MCP four helix bundle domain-containing protein [Sedimentisphaerales bacterium]